MPMILTSESLWRDFSLSLRSEIKRCYYWLKQRIGVSSETYMELGLLLESMGESAKALQCYRRGLQESHASPVPEPSNTSSELLPAVAEGR